MAVCARTHAPAHTRAQATRATRSRRASTWCPRATTRPTPTWSAPRSAASIPRSPPRLWYAALARVSCRVCGVPLARVVSCVCVCVCDCTDRVRRVRRVSCPGEARSLPGAERSVARPAAALRVERRRLAPHRPHRPAQAVELWLVRDALRPPRKLTQLIIPFSFFIFVFVLKQIIIF